MSQNLSREGKPAVTKGMSAVRPAALAARIFFSRICILHLAAVPLFFNRNMR